MFIFIYSCLFYFYLFAAGRYGKLSFLPSKAVQEKVELASFQKVDGEMDFKKVPLDEEEDVEKAPLDDETADVATTETPGAGIERKRTIVSETKIVNFEKDDDEIEAARTSSVGLRLQITPTQSPSHKRADDEPILSIGDEKGFVLKQETVNM